MGENGYFWGVLWNPACPKHGLNGSGGSPSLSGNVVRPLWVTFGVVFGCPDASDWAEMLINYEFRVAHSTKNDSRTSIYVENSGFLGLNESS